VDPFALTARSRRPTRRLPVERSGKAAAGEYRSRITATANGNCVTHCVDTSSTGDPTADAMSNRKTIQAVNQMVECAHPAADRAWTV
jgi:hypothetical protein